jgi:hypothetical protein
MFSWAGRAAFLAGAIVTGDPRLPGNFGLLFGGGRSQQQDLGFLATSGGAVKKRPNELGGRKWQKEGLVRKSGSKP